MIYFLLTATVTLLVVTTVLIVIEIKINGNPFNRCKCKCQCNCNPSTKPSAPTVGLSFPKGESVMRIIYRGVEVPANPDPNQGVQKTRVLTLVEGDAGVATEQIISGNGGKVDVIVPVASNFKSWYHYIDNAGLASDPSPETIVTNASDETPPSAPAGGMVFPKGESLPDE